MSTLWTRRSVRRPLAARVAVPREPVDPARIGRRVVRRRATGMSAADVAAALEDARFDARHEHLADDERGRAELAEWGRIGQLLADAAPDAVYDPDVDVVVQAELAAEAAAAAAREAELREAARDELTRRAGSYVQKDVDAWPAHALAGYLGHYRDPAAREAAADLLPKHLLAHAALLTELAHLTPGAGVDQLAFAARLATADPEAADSLAAFLAHARSGAS